MEDLADRLERAADALSTMDRRMPVLDIPADMVGADGAGTPGRLGREVRAHWTAVLAARSREAAEVADRLAAIAVSVRRTARQYAETDEAARRRISREM